VYKDTELKIKSHKMVTHTELLLLSLLLIFLSKVTLAMYCTQTTTLLDISLHIFKHATILPFTDNKKLQSNHSRPLLNVVIVP